jgi:hypothetical protein
MKPTSRLLVGNTFPLTLIRAPLRFTPRTHAEWHLALAQSQGILSYWGHGNSLGAASAWAGVDLTPATDRPAIVLDDRQRPGLDGQSFTHCWVLSPNYAPGFRPKEGEVAPTEAILGRQALEIVWE